jgi:uncharacterized phosphosugar-binding protein
MKEQMKKVAKSVVKSHEDKMHKGTKKMATGGKTGEMMKTYGRGMAKVMNQRGR